MKMGGYRAGAGRPPRKPKNPVPKDIVADAHAAKMQPLEYMLAVLNDATADATRRDRMAIAAAPYCHPRVADTVVGKKERAQADLMKSTDSTEWGSLVIDATGETVAH